MVACKEELLPLQCMLLHFPLISWPVVGQAYVNESLICQLHLIEIGDPSCGLHSLLSLQIAHTLYCLHMSEA